MEFYFFCDDNVLNLYWGSREPFCSLTLLFDGVWLYQEAGEIWSWQDISNFITETLSFFDVKDGEILKIIKKVQGNYGSPTLN